MCNCKKPVMDDFEIILIKKRLYARYNSLLNNPTDIDKIFLPPKEIMDIVGTILKTKDITILRLLITNLENITGVKLLS
jgi:hypothetical protein